MSAPLFYLLAWAANQAVIVNKSFPTLEDALVHAAIVLRAQPAAVRITLRHGEDGPLVFTAERKPGGPWRPDGTFRRSN